MTVNKKVLLTLFGATGDLAARKLYPALYQLYKKNILSKQFAMIGTGRRQWSDDYYREIVRNSVKDMDDKVDLQAEFADHFYYYSIDVTKVDSYQDFKNFSDDIVQKHKISGNRLFYLSMSPNFFKVITENLKDFGFLDTDGFARVIVEKPFGEDYDSAVQLAKDLNQSVNLKDLYFIDHYLGKAMLKNLIALRFSNPIIKGIWNKDHINNIQITLAERVGVEDRGDFYDQTGVMKDMVQNHILQSFALLTMAEPKSLSTKDILEEKVKAIENIDLSDSALLDSTVKGQYVAENTPGEESYRENDHVNDESTTETFAAGKIQTHQDFLEGVPIYYRSGKKLHQKMTRLDIVFRDNQESLYDNNQNVLTIHLDPEETIELTLNGKGKGLNKELDKHSMKLVKDENSVPSPSAYESLLNDALRGDQVYFAQLEEILASWKYVDRIKELWEQTDKELIPYEVYSDGPLQAFSLLEKDGHYWIF